MLDVDIWRAARGGRPGVLEPSHQQKKDEKKWKWEKKPPTDNSNINSNENRME